MDKFFSRLLLYLFLCSSFLPANNYFIHLSPAGVAEKENLLSASSLLSANKLFKAGGALFKKSVNLSLSADQFSDWLTLSVSEFHAENVLEQLIQDNLIDFYEPVGVFRVDQVYQDTQWYLETINIQNAWQVSTGIPEIIIGVIDTGIDYNHPDLRGGLWFNDAEYNGLPGVDDDNNGFIDDSLGWDFVDAPRLADGGDYLDPDNNPMDEYGSGHGTQIAGIISGQNINGDGIMGIAPGVKVMNLRAGTAAGYLEEDDVVNAVLYAVDNGVAVINMSFGDLVISRLLKDVLIYAHQQGVVLVGSAGNDASDHINYPAGLNEVISVGATAQNDYLASFSNYGNSVDLMAPGSGIPSTAVGGGYNEVTGTSFAAPMVSALAGLILSKNQDYDFNRVKNIMKTTAVEIPEESYDKYLGAGRIDAGKALQIPHGGLLEIASPRQNSSTSADTLWITGSAAHPAIKTITISYGIGIDPEEWLLIAELHHKQIINDTLAFLALKDFQEITISMNVTMNLINGENQTERIQFHIDRSPPVISSVNSIFLLDGEVQSVLVSFETDDITRARIYLKKEGETAIHGLESGYETQKHRFKIDRQQFSGTFLFKIEAGNESGLVSMDDNGGSWYGIPNDVDYAFYPFISKEWEAPPGYLLSKTTDINKNGIPEIVISAYDENNAFGPIEIYEYNAGRFDMIYQGSETAIPRDYGDINQNGLPDLLTGFGENSAIIEFSVQPAISAQIIWTDPLWSAAYGDTDEDGLFEIIGRKDNQYVVLEYRQNNTFEQVAELTNTTSGQNQYGMPNVVLVDMNGDGHLEIIFGDYDGDVVVYRNTGDNVYEQFGAYKTILPDVTELLTGISIESQNGLLYAGSHTGENMDYEHELDARYRAVEQIIYHNAGQQLISTDTSYYYGYRNTREYNSGLTINRLNGDIYLFASFFPDLYVSRFAENQLIPVWHYPQARSNTVLVGDFDADGSDEIVFNDGGKINGFSLSQQECPPAPYPIILNKADSVSITISWTALENNFYRIYRGLK
ncbi:MAG: S8 family serine peptidase [Calditrichaceae bacterium]|nr:S8 family serine peptidase [Calditrichaceae bacterium]RQV96553.1 MAG: hypothetical protein EH224_04245 [Calditrichota bacterium]